MKSVHIIGAGGPAGVGMTRCLKNHYDVTGEDSSEWGSIAMECRHKLMSDHTDLTLAVPDSMVQSGGFRPSDDQIALCQDKAKTAEVLGHLAPKTYWMRDNRGAGGAGAQMLTNYLPGRNYSQEFVYFRNEKVAEFQKERVSYSLKRRTEGLENVGSSAISVCTATAKVSEVARRALYAVADATGTELHGFYGVDLKEDENGVPRVTEINAGRLLTASYSFFWLTGYNLPLVGVRAFLGEEASSLPYYPAGYGIIRQIDQLPKLISPEMTESWTR